MMADRALLAILLGVIPTARRPGLRLLVTPDTILRWHRDIVRRLNGREILKKAGIDPAPGRSRTYWPRFLRSQAQAILACGFFTADLLDGTQAYVLAVIGHATRRIRILGVTLHPPGNGPPGKLATWWWTPASRHIGSSS
jgi:putative transposase